jgi:hypothetical protein
LARVRSARDHALRVVRERGHTKAVGPLKILEVDLDGLMIVHQTPFSGLEPEPRAPTYQHALVKQAAEPSLPYGIDVWSGKKVLSVKWNQDDRLQVISFHPGEWEERLRLISV